MKKPKTNLIALMILSILAIGCAQIQQPKYKMALSIDGRCSVYCDSVQYESLTTVYVWIDGAKMRIEGESLRVYSNTNYKPE